MKTEKRGKCHKENQEEEAARTLPGAAADIADKEHVTEREVKQDTSRLDSNPRMHKDGI